MSTTTSTTKRKKSATATSKTSARISYEPKRMVEVIDQPNPNEKGDPAYEFVAALLKRGSMPMSKLRKLAERWYEFSDDEEFVDKFLVDLLGCGLVRLANEPADGVMAKPDAKPTTSGAS